MGLASGCCSVSNLFVRISHFVFLDSAVEKLRNWLLGITESGWRWWCYTLEGYNSHHNRQPFRLPASSSCASGFLSTAFKYQGVRNILGEASAGMEARNPSTAGSKAEILSQMWWLRSTLLVLGRLRMEDCPEFEKSLGYIVSFRLS